MPTPMNPPAVNAEQQKVAVEEQGKVQSRNKIFPYLIKNRLFLVLLVLKEVKLVERYQLKNLALRPLVQQIIKY